MLCFQVKEYLLKRYSEILSFRIKNYKLILGRSLTLMIQNKNLPFYIAAILFFIIFKFVFTIADTLDLSFLITPTNKIIGLITGARSVYVADNGFYFENLNIVIDKSCSGFNFWLLCSVMLTFLSIKYFETSREKIAVFVLSLGGAYIFTVFVNASRIFASIIIQNRADHLFVKRPHYFLHESVGIITNLTFLILIYLIVEKMLNNRYTNEKLA